MKPITYRGWRIRKSGPHYLRVYDPSGSGHTPRVTSEAASRALIDAFVEHRVMTPEEHALVYGGHQR